MTGAEERLIDQNELHGYLDGELDQRSADRVEAYLGQKREAAQDIVHFGLQGDLVRRLYSPLLNRPLPPAMAAKLQQVHEQHSNKPAGGMRRRTSVLLTLMFLIAALGALFWMFERPLSESLVKLIS